MPDNLDYPNGVPSPFSSQPIQPQQPPAPPPQPVAPAPVPAQPVQQPPQYQYPLPPLPDVDPNDPNAEVVSYSSWCSGSDYDDNMLDQNIAQYMQYANRRTGFDNLDTIQPLFPGLYIIGAVPSIGKTTFVHQLVEQIAANGEYVLFFSLEQSLFQLHTKSLSRIIYKKFKATQSGMTYTAKGIQCGAANGTQELADARAVYKQTIGPRLNVVEGGFSMTVEKIIKTATRFQEQTGHKPVIVIDYLQIVGKSTDEKGHKMDIRENIDHVVQTLKDFQDEDDMTIFIVSALNRQNYMAPIEFESFKESGGIEYTADVVWGLQFWVLNDDTFNREGRIKDKRDKIKEAKEAIPRELELVCLKNRFGMSSFTVEFEYQPAFDTFEVPRIGFATIHKADHLKK